MTYYILKDDEELHKSTPMFITGAVVMFMFLFILLIYKSSKLRTCTYDYTKVAEQYKKEKAYSEFIYKKFSKQSECITTYDKLSEAMKYEVNLSAFCISEGY